MSSPLDLDSVEIGCVYACEVSYKLHPVRIEDRIPTGLVCRNLDTKREIFIQKKDVGRRVKQRIENLDQWRMQNSEWQ